MNKQLRFLLFCSGILLAALFLFHGERGSAVVKKNQHASLENFQPEDFSCFLAADLDDDQDDDLREPVSKNCSSLPVSFASGNHPALIKLPGSGLAFFAAHYRERTCCAFTGNFRL